MSLTEKEQKFLDVLFDEAKGDPVAAKKLAGYSPTSSTSAITSKLSDEIYERTKKFIAQSSTKAAYTMFSVMGDDDLLGAKERMIAAKDIMDRAGLVKTDKVEVTAKEPVFIAVQLIMPPVKNSEPFTLDAPVVVISIVPSFLIDIFWLPSFLYIPMPSALKLLILLGVKRNPGRNIASVKS